MHCFKNHVQQPRIAPIFSFPFCILDSSGEFLHPLWASGRQPCAYNPQQKQSASCKNRCSDTSRSRKGGTFPTCGGFTDRTETHICRQKTLAKRTSHRTYGTFKVYRHSFTCVMCRCFCMKTSFWARDACLRGQRRSIIRRVREYFISGKTSAASTCKIIRPYQACSNCVARYKNWCCTDHCGKRGNSW